VRPAPLDPTGKKGPTRHQARRGRWRQTTYGFHVPADTDSVRVEQRILEQSMRVGDRGAVTGWAALRMWCAAFFDGLSGGGSELIPVPLVSPSHLTDTLASTATRASLRNDQTWTVEGVRVTSPQRALVDEVLRLGDLREAVVAIDMACAAPVTSLRRMHAYLAGHPRPGNDQVVAALDLADEGSLSPMEPRMRLVWMLDAGWSRPLVNPYVFSTEGDLLGRPDLLDPESGVGGEYDGELHRKRARHRKDVGRAELFREHGLEPFTVVAGDDARTQVQRMSAARARALARSTTERRWTLEAPSWFQAPPSADDLLEGMGYPAD
jgi:hypothetical protein